MHNYKEKDIANLDDYDPHPDGKGYTFKSDNGLMAIRNASPLDEVYQHEDFGLLNISLAKRQIEKSKGLQPSLVTIEESTKEHISLVDVDHNLIDALSIQRRDEPLISVATSTGFYLLDGHHRLQRRIKDGLTNYETYILRAEALHYLGVQLYRMDAAGEWRPSPEADPKPGAIENAIEGADAFLQGYINQ